MLVCIFPLKLAYASIWTIDSDLKTTFFYVRDNLLQSHRFLVAAIFYWASAYLQNVVNIVSLKSWEIDKFSIDMSASWTLIAIFHPFCDVLLAVNHWAALAFLWLVCNSTADWTRHVLWELLHGFDYWFWKFIDVML